MRILPMKSYLLQELNSKFEEGLKMAESETGETFAIDSVSFERKASDAAYSDMCGKVNISCI